MVLIPNKIFVDVGSSALETLGKLAIPQPSLQKLIGLMLILSAYHKIVNLSNCRKVRREKFVILVEELKTICLEK